MLRSFQYKKNEYDAIPLKLVLLGANHDQEPVYRMHGINLNQIIFCKEGQGELILNNRKYVIDKGQCFIIFSNTPHEYHSTGGKWILDIVGFNGSIVPLLFRALKINSSGAYLLSNREMLEDHHKKLIEIAEQNSRHKHMLLSQETYALITDLSFCLTHIASGSADYGNPTITQTIEYLEAHYGEDVSLDTLAQITSRTPEYLCSIFKEHTGLTIVKYLNGIRLLHAQILLVQEPSMSIKEIAEKCGYSSASYFGKVFFKQYKLTPNQYRMSHIM